MKLKTTIKLMSRLFVFRSARFNVSMLTFELLIGLSGHSQGIIYGKRIFIQRRVVEYSNYWRELFENLK